MCLRTDLAAAEHFIGILLAKHVWHKQQKMRKIQKSQQRETTSAVIIQRRRDKKVAFLALHPLWKWNFNSDLFISDSFSFEYLSKFI